MKEFDYQAAKSGAPVQTRDGHKARIICWDKAGATKIVALIAKNDDGGKEFARAFHENGLFSRDRKSPADLVMVPVTHTFYTPVYRIEEGGAHATGLLYETKEKAEESGRAYYGDRFKVVVKVEWEEE